MPTVLPTYTNALYVTPTPNVNGQYYSVGTTLTFSCSGTEGSDKRIHTWCYKQAGSITGFTNVYVSVWSTRGLTLSGQSITITGTSTLVPPTSELRITCQPSTAGIRDVNTISIQKNTSSTDYTTLVYVTYDKACSSSVIRWASTAYQNRQGVSATGNVDTVGGARLVLTISTNNTRCEDGGAYRCNMGVLLLGGGGAVAVAEKYVTATVSGQSITITGTSTLVTPTSELRITCQPSSACISDVSTISVQKNTSSTDYTSIVTVAYDKASSSSVISWAYTAFQNRQGVSATGNVDTVGGARLVLTISTNNIRCEDGGAYRCNMEVTLTGGGGATANADKYVTATVLPTYTNALYVTPTPNVNGQYYSVGTKLTFSCSGTVGSDKMNHTWCYKQADSNTGFTGYPTAADINQNENGLVQDGCNYRRRSTLTYNVTAADTETSFMCEPFTGSMCGTSAAVLKTNYTVRLCTY
ncbi:hypothetical protein KP79_PYT22581 [Mizuhopecten yessoensis]|uniref:Ig-like domain-containing protein n=1 Tax=Mizuhopecten yessoensis TaxID=6573 RepID=A0A210PJX0_MIZYE|nr:hypothetical protein KP79_PYT22581 [Mizuhopecten yessoensis]